MFFDKNMLKDWDKLNKNEILVNSFIHFNINNMLVT